MNPALWVAKTGLEAQQTLRLGCVGAQVLHLGWPEESRVLEHVFLPVETDVRESHVHQVPHRMHHTRPDHEVLGGEAGDGVAIPVEDHHIEADDVELDAMPAPAFIAVEAPCSDDEGRIFDTAALRQVFVDRGDQKLWQLG